MTEFKNHLAYKRSFDELDVAVVDDSKFTQMLIRTILQPLRLKKLRCFDTAEAALADMQQDMPGLLISDWRVQNAEGLKLLEILRKAERGRLACISAIVTLANPTRHDTQAALRLGAHAVVAKPFSLQSLQRRVQWVLHDERRMKLQGERYIIEGSEPQAKRATPAEAPAAPGEAGKREVA